MKKITLFALFIVLAGCAIRLVAQMPPTNTAFGESDLANVTIGTYNTAFGYANLIRCTTCYGNTAFGTQNQYYLVSGTRNSSFGYASMVDLVGDNNSAFGFASAASITTGHDNSAFGEEALRFITTGNYNNAFGAASVRSIGYSSSYNNAFGSSTLYNNIADWNSAFGHATLVANTTGTQNSAFGGNALYGNTTGSYQAAVGFTAGSYLADGVTPAATSMKSVYLGAYTTSAATDGQTNQIVIGYQAASYGSNTATIGNPSVVRWVPGAHGVTSIGAPDRRMQNIYLVGVGDGDAGMVEVITDLTHQIDQLKTQIMDLQLRLK